MVTDGPSHDSFCTRNNNFFPILLYYCTPIRLESVRAQLYRRFTTKIASAQTLLSGAKER